MIGQGWGGGAISVSPLCTYKGLMNIYMKKMHILCSLKWVLHLLGFMDIFHVTL